MCCMTWCQIVLSCAALQSNDKPQQVLANRIACNMAAIQNRLMLCQQTLFNEGRLAFQARLLPACLPQQLFCTPQTLHKPCMCGQCSCSCSTTPSCSTTHSLHAGTNACALCGSKRYAHTNFIPQFVNTFWKVDQNSM